MSISRYPSFYLHFRYLIKKRYLMFLFLCYSLTSQQLLAQQSTEYDLVHSLRESMKTEKDVVSRIFLAKSIIRLAPEDEVAANELISALVREDELVISLRANLASEKNALARILTAKALLRLAPDESAAASEITTALVSQDDFLPAEAYKAIDSIIHESQPALIAALNQLTKNPLNSVRHQADSLLAKIDPSKKGDNFIQSAAYRSISEVISEPSAPLVLGLMNVLKDPASTVGVRRQVTQLLSKVNPKVVEELLYMSLRYNHVRQKSSHNSYERDESIFDQVAYWRIRSLEFDLHNGKGAELQGDWRIYHRDFPGLDTSNIFSLKALLNLFRGINRSIPKHEVITVFIEFKDALVKEHTPELFDHLVKEILGDENIYTPAQLLHETGSPSLQNAVSKSWPRLASLRGKFIFVITGEDTVINQYASDAKQAANRVGFIAPAIKVISEIDTRDYAIFFNMEASDVAKLAPTVYQKNFVSRAYGIDDTNWGLCSKFKVHHLATDDVNSQSDGWARTYNDNGWPFQEIVPTGNPAFREPGLIHSLIVRSEDVQDEEDSCFYVYNNLPTTDKEITVIAAISVPSSDVETWAKGHLMARSSLDPGAAYFSVLKPGDNHGPIVQFRAQNGSDTTEIEGNIADKDTVHAEIPMLVKIMISDSGRTVSAWGSYIGDASNWKFISSHTFSGERMRYLGIAASSHNSDKAIKILFNIVKGPSDFTHQTSIGKDVSGQIWEKGVHP